MRLHYVRASTTFAIELGELRGRFAEGFDECQHARSRSIQAPLVRTTWATAPAPIDSIETCRRSPSRALLSGFGRCRVWGALPTRPLEGLKLCK